MKNMAKPGSGPSKSVWDERQQQSYHTINSRAFNLAWTLLLLSFLVQVVLFPGEPGRWLVEMGLFMVLSIYMGAAYFRAGLWTMRSQQPSLRQSLLASVVAALLITAFSLIRMAVSGQWEGLQQADNAWSIISYLLLQAIIVFAAALILLSLISHYHRKKQREADAALDTDE